MAKYITAHIAASILRAANTRFGRVLDFAVYPEPRTDEMQIAILRDDPALPDLPAMTIRCSCNPEPHFYWGHYDLTPETALEQLATIRGDNKQ